MAVVVWLDKPLSDANKMLGRKTPEMRKYNCMKTRNLKRQPPNTKGRTRCKFLLHSQQRQECCWLPFDQIMERSEQQGPTLVRQTVVPGTLFLFCNEGKIKHDCTDTSKCKPKPFLFFVRGRGNLGIGLPSHRGGGSAETGRQGYCTR